jgi:L-fucose isomerase
MVSMLAAGGALNQLGITHSRVSGDFNEPSVIAQALHFCRCAHVVSSLKGAKYGMFGGRSLGMYSTTIDMQDWMQLFGVDVEHIDESEIVRVAETIPAERVEQAFNWLTENIGEIKYDGRQLTPEKLKTQIRHYEATQQLIKEHELDFISVKCHYDMSKHHCTQCLTAAFCNDPYDWHGKKEPTVMGCETDGDAALTMQILKKLTNNGPVIFMDIRHIDGELDVMVFANCGSQSTFYAACSDDPQENLKHVTLYPALDIYAGGGAHVNLMTKAGTATIARLLRRKGKYRMTIIPAEFVEVPREKMAETTAAWPHVFAKLQCSYDRVLQSFDANHCHSVYGDHVQELITVCEMLGIEHEVLN